MEDLFYLPSSMLWPLLACLVLTGIHVYLGVHVIARKVIFVDLALAQIAALGTVIGVLLGYEAGKDTTALYLYSLAFTIFGAFIFSVTKMKGEKVPHEAIIGIVYAVTFAGTMLVLSRSALGPQELDHIIKGELLWVQPSTVLTTALIYSLVGLFHFVFRKKFLPLSFDPASMEGGTINVRLWDFLFYMSFGFVITSSVSIAGVFLVFSYLVIPSVGAMLLSDRLSTRLIIGWIGGSICSFVGVKLSWNTGLPTSPLVVCVLAFALILSGLYRYLRTAPSAGWALRRIVQAAAVVMLFVLAVLFFRKAEEEPLQHALHMLRSRLGTERVTAVLTLRQFADQKESWLPDALEALHDEDVEVRKAAIALVLELKERSALSEIRKLLTDDSDDVRLAVIRALRSLGSGSDGDALTNAAKQEEDPELQLELLHTALDLGSSEAIPVLAKLTAEGGVFADEAYGTLSRHLRLEFKKNDTAMLLRWYEKNRASLQWDPSTRTFSAPQSR